MMRVRTRGAPLLDHDHERCVAEALDAALDLCERRGNRLTPVRRRVLELVWRSHEPVGAYALLELLRDDGWSAAPPGFTVERQTVEVSGICRACAERRAS